MGQRLPVSEAGRKSPFMSRLERLKLEFSLIPVYLLVPGDVP